MIDPTAVDAKVVFSALAAARREAGDIDTADQILQLLETRRRWIEAKEKVEAQEKELEAKKEELLDTRKLLRELELRSARIDAKILEMSCINEAGAKLANNPIFIWGEILISDLNKPLPIWVQDYLHHVASELLKTAEDKKLTGVRSLDRLKKIFGFSRRRWNAFTDIRKFEKASKADELASGDGTIAEIAKRMGVEPNTIYVWRRRAKKHLKVAMALYRAQRTRAK